MTYTMTAHARRRIVERGITTDDLAGALAGPRRIARHGPAVEYFNPRSGVGIVVNRVQGTIVTVYRKKGRR